jgi:putative ABC transport system permease protein
VGGCRGRGQTPYDPGLMSLETLLDDVRVAWRVLRHAGGFTGAAVLTLATGIAGTTIMFALVEGVLLRPPPFPEPNALLVAWKQLPSAGLEHFPFSVSEINVLARETRLLESLAGVGYNGAGASVVVENGSATYINTASVGGDFFRVIGVEPVLGRALNGTDDVSGVENVMVITYRLWQRRYAAAPDVLGRRLTVDGQPFTIVGVMPRDFDYPRGVDAWMTLRASASTLTNPAFREGVLRDVDLIARLRAGATIGQATSELQALTSRLETRASPDAPRGFRAVVQPFQDIVVGDVRTAILILFSAMGLVLLIASANVANLLLLRGESRRQEFAVRAALGASGFRLAREVLTETVLIALAAGATGLTVASWTLHAVVTLVPEGLPRVDAVRIDVGVALFTLALAIFTAGLAGFAPALVCVRGDVASELRKAGTHGRTTVRRGRRALVVAQVALAVTIIAAAGLLVRTLMRLEAVDMGLAADHLVFVELDLPQGKYADDTRHLQVLNELIAQLEAAPGIAGATPVNTAPFAGTGGWDAPVFTAEGQTADRVAANPSLNLESVHPNYFQTLDVRLVRGRGFTHADGHRGPLVAIVSEDVAARTWPGADPIGKRIKLGDTSSADPWRTVVGVARPTRYRELADVRPTLYLPAEQFIVAARMLVARTALPLTQVAAVVGERVRSVDPQVRVMRVAPFAQLLEKPLARPRFNARLIAAFGLTALALASIGLYTLMSAFVRQRYREIAIRVALGAPASNVRRLVLAEGLRLTLAGVALGLTVALSAARMLRGLLFGVRALDPASMIGAALLLVAISMLAAYLPARRATRMDPIQALRMN